jgi:hypothetical protein
MSHYIVKIDRDTDLYVNWSTIVDAPGAIGTREGLADYLRFTAGEKAADAARFDRADATGTSSIVDQLTYRSVSRSIFTM